MAERALMVRAVQFNGDGSVAIDYLQQDDQRANGMMMSRALLIPAPEEDGDPEMADELEDLERTTQRVLRAAINQHESARPVTDDDPDRPGPYDNPLD